MVSESGTFGVSIRRFFYCPRFCQMNYVQVHVKPKKLHMFPVAFVSMQSDAHISTCCVASLLPAVPVRYN